MNTEQLRTQVNLALSAENADLRARLEIRERQITSLENEVRKLFALNRAQDAQIETLRLENSTLNTAIQALCTELQRPEHEVDRSEDAWWRKLNADEGYQESTQARISGQV